MSRRSLVAALVHVGLSHAAVVSDGGLCTDTASCSVVAANHDASSLLATRQLEKGALGSLEESAGASWPKYHNKPRVRRQWRTVSPEIKAKVVHAFWTFKNLTTEEGGRIYGKHFHNHDDMVFLHICSAKDLRCDQGHLGPQFMTFHRALLLKYELALLSVEPEIGAMPYRRGEVLLQHLLRQGAEPRGRERPLRQLARGAVQLATLRLERSLGDRGWQEEQVHH